MEKPVPFLTSALPYMYLTCAGAYISQTSSRCLLIAVQVSHQRIIISILLNVLSMRVWLWLYYLNVCVAKKKKSNNTMKRNTRTLGKKGNIQTNLCLSFQVNQKKGQIVQSDSTVVKCEAYSHLLSRWGFEVWSLTFVLPTVCYFSSNIIFLRFVNTQK